MFCNVFLWFFLREIFLESGVYFSTDSSSVNHVVTGSSVRIRN
jgi:hypothetical protein